MSVTGPAGGETFRPVLRLAMAVKKAKDARGMNGTNPRTIAELKPSEFNPREITASAMAGLKESVAEFGDISGIVYNRTLDCLVAGHQRVEALRAKFGTDLAIEETPEMAAKYAGPPTLVVTDALTYDFEMFDFAVAFLALMFFPVASRIGFLNGLISRTRPGGAVVVVDKLVTPPGYCGTALRRLAMSWKLDSGTSPDDVVRKELSLAGYQRPLSPNLFHGRGEVFFMFGEFIGWICERSEA